MEVVRGPEFNAGCNTGPGTPHWILTSVWPHCGIMDVVRGPESNAGCNAGAGTPYVIPTSVWDPLRDIAGSWTPCGARKYMRDAMRGPGPQAVFKAGPVFIRDPEFRAASSMRDPVRRAESGCHVGSIVS